MAKNSQIIQEIVEHVRACGGSYSGWYVGVAADPRARLFNDHNVSQQHSSWIFRTCASTEEARAVEDHFIEQGMKGGAGGGDYDTTAVYAYAITSNTRQ